MPHKEREPRKNSLDLINLGTAFNRLLVDQDYNEVQDGAYYEFLKVCQKQINKDGKKLFDIDEQTLGILKWNLLAYNLGFQPRPLPHLDETLREDDLESKSIFYASIPEDTPREESPYWFGVYLLNTFIDSPDGIPLYLLRHFITPRSDDNYTQFSEAELHSNSNLEIIFKKEISDHDRSIQLIKDFRKSNI